MGDSIAGSGASSAARATAQPLVALLNPLVLVVLLYTMRMATVPRYEHTRSPELRPGR
jgi:hypothetical protein